MSPSDSSQINRGTLKVNPIHSLARALADRPEQSKGLIYSFWAFQNLMVLTSLIALYKSPALWWRVEPHRPDGTLEHPNRRHCSRPRTPNRCYRRPGKNKERVPPGPPRYPIIGNVLNFPMQGWAQMFPEWHRKYGTHKL